MAMWPWNNKPDIEPAPISQVPEAPQASQAMALADALPDPCIILARNGLILHANSGAIGIFGQAAGQHVSAAIRAPVVLEAVERVRNSQTPERLEFERRGGQGQHYECWIAPIAQQDASAPAMVIMLKDLTRAQMIERMRADFVANASHELRTPLTALLGFIETLQGPARDDTNARARFLDLMRVQGQRMKRLIDDLLSLSRIEMNAHQQPEKIVDLEVLCRHVSDILAPVLADESMQIRLDLTLGLEVRGERDELIQVLQNLIENATKYASEGKFIDITTRSQQGFAEIVVRDYGKGISAEHLPRLTERFYRVNVQESRTRGGTGLGLAIVKHIISRHRGELKIRSKAGEGSSFIVTLPLVQQK